MTAPFRELFANNAADQLDGGIDASQTSITVDDGSVFPSTGNFRIIIDDELMIVSDRSSNTLTVVRGAEGTTGASHLDDAPVTHVITADALDRVGKDNVMLWGASTFPPLNKLVGTDGKTILTSADFTWQNQGGATVADLAGTMAMRLPPSGSNQIRSLLRSTPSAPWTWISAVNVTCFADDDGAQNVNQGVCLRESSSSKLYLFGWNRSNTATPRIYLEKWNNDTTFASVAYKITKPIFFGPLLWFKIEDNNTNVIFSIGSDGVEWFQVFSESRTTFMSSTGPNQYGLSGNNGSNSSGSDSVIRLVHSHTE
jgi:hypothetical protein